MNKVIGLIILLSTTILVGALYWQTRDLDTQKLPESYQVLDQLEKTGLFAGDEVSIETMDGKSVLLSQFRGKVIILSFWATWCEPCVEEFPSLVKLMETYPEDVVLIAISHDYEAQEVNDFVEAFKGRKPNLTLVLDKQKKLSKIFAVDRLPEGFIFDRAGLLQKKIIGIQDWASPQALQYFEELVSKDRT